MNTIQKAEFLATHYSKELDLDRKFSGGVNGPKNFIEATKSSNNLSWEIANPSAEDVVIAIGTLRGSMFSTAVEALEALGAKCFLADGVIFTVGDGDDPVEITAKSKTAGREINHIINYASQSPTQLVSMNFRSSLINGQPDYSNLTGVVKTIFTTPFRTQQESELELSNYQDSSSNSPQFANVNFVEAGFPVIISNENFVLLTVNAGTKLNLSLKFGLSNSQAQEFYRGMKGAQKALATVGAKSC